MTKKQQQTKTTKHTIEFSNNTPTPTAPKARGCKPRASSSDNKEATEVVPSWDAIALCGRAHVATASLSYVRHIRESNKLLVRAFQLRRTTQHA